MVQYYFISDKDFSDNIIYVHIQYIITTMIIKENETVQKEGLNGIKV